MTSSVFWKIKARKYFSQEFSSYSRWEPGSLVSGGHSAQARQLVRLMLRRFQLFMCPEAKKPLRLRMGRLRRVCSSVWSNRMLMRTKLRQQGHHVQASVSVSVRLLLQHTGECVRWRARFFFFSLRWYAAQRRDRPRHPWLIRANSINGDSLFCVMQLVALNNNRPFCHSPEPLFPVRPKAHVRGRRHQIP